MCLTMASDGAVLARSIVTVQQLGRDQSIMPKQQHIYSRYSSTLGSYCSIYFRYTSSLGSYCRIYCCRPSCRQLGRDRSCRNRAHDSVDDTLQLTEDQPLIMISPHATTIHCYFAYNFNVAMISNSIKTVHSVSGGHGKIQWVILCC